MTRPDDDLALNDHLEPDERDLEAPTADAAEQATSADPGQAESGESNWRGDERSRSLEVGEWDAFEQSVVVDLDDDDYDR